MRIIVVRDFSHLEGHEKLVLCVIEWAKRAQAQGDKKIAASSFSVSRRRMGQNDIRQALLTTTSA